MRLKTEPRCPTVGTPPPPPLLFIPPMAAHFQSPPFNADQSQKAEHLKEPLLFQGARKGGGIPAWQVFLPVMTCPGGRQLKNILPSQQK
jgi:hypothetical protein